MITIVVKPTFCKVLTTDRLVHSFLDKKFSACVDGAFFSKAYKNKVWDGKHHAYDKLSGTFKIGLLKPVVKELVKQGYEVQVQEDLAVFDNNEPINESLLYSDQEGFRKLRDYQVDGVNVMIRDKVGIVKAATNAGKTEMFCEVLRRLNLSATIICTRKELFHQTADRLRLRLGVPIGQVGDGIAKIEKITMVMPGSIVKSFTPEGKKKKVQRIPECYGQLLESDILILDECHNFGDSRIGFMVDRMSARYRFGLSGTPLMKGKVEKLKLTAHFGEVMFEISNQQLIAAGISSVPTCYFIKEEVDDISELPYEVAYKVGVVQNQVRNQKAASIADLMVDKYGKTVLLICAHVEHCGMLSMEIPDAVVCHGGCSSAFRKDTLARFKAGEIKKLISTTIYDEGIDTDQIDVIIMAAGMMTPEKIIQRIGRGLRKRASMQFTYFDFLDVGNSYLLDHSTKRVATLRKEKFTVKLFND